jgi:ketosteroid isomerase-like protein
MALSTDDRVEITQLYAKYNFALDFGDSAGWAATFTPDGVFSSATGTFNGSDELKGFAEGFAARMKARHWTNNLVIEEGASGAEGKCYLALYKLGDEGGPSILVSGVYNDELTKTAEGWRFKSRKVTGD